MYVRVYECEYFLMSECTGGNLILSYDTSKSNNTPPFFHSSFVQHIYLLITVTSRYTTFTINYGNSRLFEIYSTISILRRFFFHSFFFVIKHDIWSRRILSNGKSDNSKQVMLEKDPERVLKRNILELWCDPSIKRRSDKYKN